MSIEERIELIEKKQDALKGICENLFKIWVCKCILILMWFLTK